MDVDLINATIIAADPSADSELRRRANCFCDEFIKSPDGFKISVDLYDKKGEALSPITRMFCLTVMEKNIEDRYREFDKSWWESFRIVLWRWIGDSMNAENFIRNKLVNLMVKMFEMQYPEDCPNFFGELLFLTEKGDIPQNQYDSKVEMFLKICKTINEDLIKLYDRDSSKQLEKSNEIKNSMREFSISALVSQWIDLMVTYYQSNSCKIVQLCIELLSEYISWIPIELVTNNRIIQFLYEYLNVSSLCPLVLECFSQMVNKGMPYSDKVFFIQNLNVNHILETAFRLSNSFEIKGEIVNLLSITGSSLCESWKSESTQAHEKEICLKQLEDLYKYVEILVSNQAEEETLYKIYPYIHGYIHIVDTIYKKSSDISQSSAIFSKLESLLRVIILAIKYQDTCTIEDVLEEDSLEAKRREPLKKLFETIANVKIELVISYVSQISMETLQEVGSQLDFSWQKLELILYMIDILSEPLKRQTKSPTVSMFIVSETSELTPLSLMIRKVIETNKAYQENPVLSLGFLNIVYKYVQYFELNSAEIPEVLNFIVGKGGLNHIEPQVRNKSQYVLRHLIKTLKSRMTPFADELTNNIKKALCKILNEAPQYVEIKTLDQIPKNNSPKNFYILEAMGSLILLSDIPSDKKVGFLREIVDPAINCIKEIINTRFYENYDSPYFSIYIYKLNQAIVALGNLCKDFSGSEINDKKNKLQVDYKSSYSDILKEVLDIIIEVLKILHNVFHIRTAAIFSLRRMVDCQKENVLDHLDVLVRWGLLNDMSIGEMASFMDLFTQIIAKFKRINEGIADLMYFVFVRLFSLSDKSDEGIDHQQEMLELRRNYTNFVTQILQTGDATYVFEQSQNAVHFGKIVESMVGFALDSDTVTQKQAIAAISKIVSIFGKDIPESQTNVNTNIWWGKSPNGSVLFNGMEKVEGVNLEHGDKEIKFSDFGVFILQKIVPLLFAVLNSSNISPGNNFTNGVIAEITKIHFLIYKIKGLQYSSYLGNSFFPSSGVPSQYVTKFLFALSSSDHKALQKILNRYAEDLKDKKSNHSVA